MSSDDWVMRVGGLAKCYHIYEQPRDRLKQFVMPRLRRSVGLSAKSYFREFWALRDVGFEVRRGEAVGIVGRNGSGKSTLLQLVCGTLNPTAGDVEVRGRVAALLELGSGFNPEFSGRENVYLNATLLGLTTEEIDARFDEIAAFANIGRFIEQPVKTYSSGMFVRLAFAVIAHVDADILVIDEALAVGDVFFQQKCMRFLKRFRENGGSLLLVSHDTAAVLSMCEKALLLSPMDQRKPYFGGAEEVCKVYLEDLYADPSRGNPGADADDVGAGAPLQTVFRGEPEAPAMYSVSPFNQEARAFGEGKATIVDAGFFDADGRRLNALKAEDRVSLRIEVNVHQRVVFPAFGFMLKNRHGEFLFTEGTDSTFRSHGLCFEAGQKAVANFEFDMPQLIQGVYTVNVAFAEGLGHEHQQQHWLHDALVLEVLRSRQVHGYCGVHGLVSRIELGGEHG
ncbi:ABC transporter ATP-binding protein [Achromobacter sp. GG226]|uniref:ABC transporter ATP-binding protein n=1 Tax=Verticiella alkaliphila TaxID=2779529 RepID=UPI001C0B9952|nr:ABC transporter ATP-binding protein [Verticiella sp. GG226]MBU4609195.1 ABC transporter ATP-binding protein [Verticiella sp. GG226]